MLWKYSLNLTYVILVLNKWHIQEKCKYKLFYLYMIKSVRMTLLKIGRVPLINIQSSGDSESKSSSSGIDCCKLSSKWMFRRERKALKDSDCWRQSLYGGSWRLSSHCRCQTKWARLQFRSKFLNRNSIRLYCYGWFQLMLLTDILWFLCWSLGGPKRVIILTLTTIWKKYRLSV